jgi:hypothetical protein
MAMAVVVQAGQSPLNAAAALMGAMIRLWPSRSTTWTDTATVVHLLQLTSAKARLVSVTGAPSLAVTSE